MIIILGNLKKTIKTNKPKDNYYREPKKNDNNETYNRQNIINNNTNQPKNTPISSNIIVYTNNNNNNYSMQNPNNKYKNQSYGINTETILANQSRNYSIPTTKVENKESNKPSGLSSYIDYKQFKNLPIEKIEKIENKKGINYKSPNNKAEINLPKNYAFPANRLDNKEPIIIPSEKIEINQPMNNKIPTTKLDNKLQINYTHPNSKIDNKQPAKYTSSTTSIDNKIPIKSSHPTEKIDNKQPINYIRQTEKIENKKPFNYTSIGNLEDKKSNINTISNKKIDYNKPKIFSSPINKIESKYTDHNDIPATKIEYKKPESTSINSANVKNIDKNAKNTNINQRLNKETISSNIRYQRPETNKNSNIEKNISNPIISQPEKDEIKENTINESLEPYFIEKKQIRENPKNISNTQINNNEVTQTQYNKNKNLQNENKNLLLHPKINEEEKCDKISKIEKLENLPMLQNQIITNEKVIPSQKDNNLLYNDNNIQNKKEISPKFASKIKYQYIKHEKKPKTLEGWKELKHIFKIWKNLINNKEEIIKNPEYVAWFRRNCNDNKIPEASKIEQVNHFFNLDLDMNDENNPIVLDNYLNKIKKEKESYEAIPYDEWFNKNCEKPTISNNNFILPFETKYIPKAKNKKEEKPLISLNDILEEKPNSETSINSDEQKNKNNPYNEKEMKNIFHYVNSIKNNKDKKNAISSLRNSVDNDIKRNQIDKLNDLIEKNIEKEEINHIIEKNKNPRKKELLNNIVDLWDSKNKIEEKEFFDNIENYTVNLMSKEEQKKKINDMINKKEANALERKKSINKVANIMNKFDKDKKQEMMQYLKENNKEPKQEEKLRTLNDILLNKEKEEGLIKLFGGENIKENKNEEENEQRINEIIDNLNNLDNESKSNILRYMKHTAKGDEEKNKDLNKILNNINIEDQPYNLKNSSVIANDGSINEELPAYIGQEKSFSITDASLRNEEEISLDNLNESNSEIAPKENISVFINDDELMDFINEIEKEKTIKTKKLDDDEFNFMIDGILDDLLNNRDNNENKNKVNEKENIDNAVNTMKHLNKEDQIKTINTLKSVADKDEKKKEIVQNLQNNIKKIWKTKNLIKNILDKKKREDDEKEKEKEKSNVENKNEDKIEKVTLDLLSDVLNGEIDLNKDDFNNYYNEYKNIENKKDEIEDDNKQIDKITFIEKEGIDKAAEKLNNLNENEQGQVIKRLRGRMKKPKEKIKFDKLIKKLNNIKKIKSLAEKIKKKPLSTKEEKLEKEEENKDEIDKLGEDELKELTNIFITDLYDIKKEEPKSRAQKREEEKENDEKIKNIAKAINGLNKDDKDYIMENIRNNANNEKKNEQFNRLKNLINSANNLKSYVNQLIINKNKEKENKEINNNLDKNDLEDLQKIFIEDLFPEEKEIENETKISDNHLNKLENDKIKNAVEIIKDLNSSQQKEVLENLKSKAAEEKNLEKFKKIFKKVKNINKMNNIINQLSKKEDTKNNISHTNDIQEKKLEKKEESKQLGEEEFINIAENMINYLYNEDKYIPNDKVNKYMNQKEKEENVNKVANVINNMNNKDKENMLQLLNENADTPEKKVIFKSLINKIKAKAPNDNINEEINNEIKMDNKINEEIENEYKKEEEEKEELNDDQLTNLVNSFIDCLFENAEKEAEEKEKSINKVANVIKDLNKNDQKKALSLLEENANDHNKKQKVEKVSNLVNNMNGIKSYLKGIIKKRINRKENKELGKEKIDHLSQSILNDLFKEESQLFKNEENFKKEPLVKIPTKVDENLNDINDTLNNHNETDKKRVLNILVNNAKNDKNQEDLKNSENKKRKIVKLFVNNLKNKKKEKEKPKLSDEEINNIAYQFSSDLYNLEKEPKTSLENLLINENKENKIEEFAESLKSLDKEQQDKALSIIKNNAINEEQKENANKLTNLVKNINNMKSYFGKMIKSKLNKKSKFESEKPLIGDFKNDDQLSKIVNSFWIDLNNSKINNKDKVYDIINNFANIVKELGPKDQFKIIDLLKQKVKEENINFEEIYNLEKRLNELNNMKNEIESYKNSLINNENKKSFENKELEGIEEIPQKKEIIIEKLDSGKLQQLTDDFCNVLNEEEDKPEENKEKPVILRGKLNRKKEDDEKVNNIANIVTKLNQEDQKKIMHNLDKNVKNNNMPKLFKKIEKINKIKDISKIIKERKNKKKEEQKSKEIEIMSLYENNKGKNLPEEKLENIAGEIISDLFDDKDKENKNEQNTNKYLLKDLKKEEKIKNISNVLNKLNDRDKKCVLEKLSNYNNDKGNEIKNKMYLNKLEKLLNNFDKMKLYTKRIKAKLNKEKEKERLSIIEKENQSPSNNINTQELADKFISNLFNESNKFPNTEDKNIEKMAVEIAELSNDNQNEIINKIKEKSNTDEKNNQFRILLKKLEHISKIRNLARKIKEKKALKKVEEEIKNEDNYGIIIQNKNEDKNEQEEVIIKKPEEMNENDLNKLTQYFISDLYKKDNMMKDENGNEIKENPVEKYKKIKKLEKRMNDIADTINNLDDKDKQKILTTIYKNAKNNEDKNRYKKLIHRIVKGLNKLDKEKKVAKQKVLKEIEDKNKIIKENRLIIKNKNKDTELIKENKEELEINDKDKKEKEGQEIKKESKYIQKNDMDIFNENKEKEKLDEEKIENIDKQKEVKKDIPTIENKSQGIKKEEEIEIEKIVNLETNGIDLLKEKHIPKEADENINIYPGNNEIETINHNANKEDDKIIPEKEEKNN